MSTTDRIEKRIDLAAPVDRVWRAITDYREFGEWFRVKLESPFTAGRKCCGKITYPGYEHLAMEVDVVAIEPMHRFAFYWHPYAIDPNVDYSREPPTLVEFLFEPTATGTHLTVIESGFDALPPQRRDEAFRMNDGGWTIQCENILAYVQNNH
jgi:uncharacterized protein YndB with AHSA1/START domain